MWQCVFFHVKMAQKLCVCVCVCVCECEYVCECPNKSNLLATVPVRCDFIALAVGKELESRVNITERKL